MIWLVVGIVAFILIKFLSALNKDNEDLRGQSLDQKFSVVVNAINESAFNGLGSVTRVDKREFNLYQDGQNQIIKFLYGTGHLTIIWKYKYFQKEVEHQRQFSDVRNLSIFQQQRIAEIMIGEMALVIERHQREVLSGI